jgi:hypothetical protein
MGVWGVSGSIGVLLGLYVMGPVLQFVGGTHEKGHYKPIGYIVVFMAGAVAFVLQAIIVKFIKKVK